MSTLPQSDRPDLIAFAEFEFSPSRLELWRNGKPVRLQQQPLKVLAALLRHPGELVAREDLRRELWESGIHLDFEDALNHAVKYLRDALGDKASQPQFIETVPRRGYRFVAPVQEIEPEEPTPAVESIPAERPLPAPAVPSMEQKGTWWRRPHVVATVALVVVALGLSIWKSAAARTAPRVVSAIQLTHFGLAHAVVSDGTRLYVDQVKAGVHSIVVFPADGSGPPAPLVTPFHDVHLLDISPDRKRLLVAVTQATGSANRLWEIPLSGGGPEEIGDTDCASAKWSPDGSRIACVGTIGTVTGLYVMHTDGSEPRILAPNATYVESWSPDEHSVWFTRMNVSGGLSMWEVGVDGRNERQIQRNREVEDARWGEGQCCGVWTRDGQYFLYEEASSRTTRVMAIRNRAMLDPAPQPFEVYSASFQGSGIGSSLAIGPGNQLLVVGWNEERELARYDSTIRKFVPIFPDIQAREIALSPDGHWLAYTSMPGLALWKMNLSNGKRTELTFGPGQTFGPAWSPDGTKIAVHVLLPGKPGKVEIVPADGGAPKVLFADENTQEDSQNWSPSGQSVLMGRVWFGEAGNVAQTNFCIVDLNNGRATKVPGSDHLGAVSWSPDGRYLAAQSEDFHKLLLFDFRTSRWQTVATGALIWRPLWSHDSRSVIYQDARAGQQQPIYRLSIDSGKSQQVATRSEILESNLSGYSLAGINADDMPIVTLLRRNADVYGVDLRLP